MKITADAIIYNNQIYPTKNISSARMVERQAKRVPNNKEKSEFRRKQFYKFLMLLLAFVVVILFSQTIKTKSDAAMATIGILMFSTVPILLFAAYFFLSALFGEKPISYTDYGIELSTNSGQNTLFYSHDLEFISKIRDLIFEVLSSSSREVNYEINIDNRNIADYSVNITNHNYDYSINYTKYEGIQPKDLEFLTGQFTSALGQLAGEISALKNPDVNKEFETLNQELKKPTPNPDAVKTTWGKLKGLCEVYDIGDKLTSIVTLGITIITTVATKVAASS